MKGGVAVKKMIRAVALMLVLLFACACASNKTSSTTITAAILDGAHYSVSDGSVLLEPGETAVFSIETDPGYTVTAADYRGDYRLVPGESGTVLELLNVRYPTRVTLSLSQSAASITYDANGGTALTSAGLTVTEQYDIQTHTRPNVSIGTNLYTRNGYTLTGWNTAPDGSGTSVGLGSRVTADEPLTLYAQWAKWTDETQFTCRIEDGNAIITGCSETGKTVVVPETLNGFTVTAIDREAFRECPAETVILPKTLLSIADYAFIGAKLSTLYFFDNIETFSDASFHNCKNLCTLRISAIEDPYGYKFRRESVLADKFDLLINTMGEDRLIFYGGCSMWYNLIGEDVKAQFGERYTVVNMAINGLSNSLLQMELMRCFMTEHDILVHTPEIASTQQLMTDVAMSDYDDKLWCAFEYNYDLVSLIDIRVTKGVFDTFRQYLDKKKPGGTYADEYHDSRGNAYWDGDMGCIPYVREQGAETLSDAVSLNPDNLKDLSRLAEEYATFTALGVKIYVTYACIDIDQVPENERGNLDLMGELFTARFSEMDGVTVFGDIHDFVYHDADFYDTVYHLLTAPAKHCTAVWMRDLSAQLLKDGLWGETP